MRTTGIIAGSLGVTLVLGLLVLGVLVGVAALWLGAPARDEAAIVAAVVEHGEDLSWCAAGTAGGRLTATVVVSRGHPTHVAISEATVSQPVAACVADALATLPWPAVTGAARVPLELRR